MPTLDIQDTRDADGRIALLLEGLDEDLDRIESDNLVRFLAKRLRAHLAERSSPALIERKTLREAIKRNLITRNEAISIVSLQEELEDSAARVASGEGS